MNKENAYDLESQRGWAGVFTRRPAEGISAGSRHPDRVSCGAHLVQATPMPIIAGINCCMRSRDLVQSVKSIRVREEIPQRIEPAYKTPMELVLLAFK